MSEWIPVTERVPADGERVLALFPKMREKVAIGEVLHRNDGIIWFYNGTSGHELHFPSLKFTHWMPLPEPPK